MFIPLMINPYAVFATVVPDDYMSDLSLNYAGEFDPKGFEIIVTPMSKKEKKALGFAKNDPINVERARGIITFRGETSPEIQTIEIFRTQFNPDLGYLYIFQQDMKWYKVRYLDIS